MACKRTVLFSEGTELNCLMTGQDRTGRDGSSLYCDELSLCDMMYSDVVNSH